MNITELKALAEKATPGPWLHEKENVHAGGVCSVNQGGEPWFEVWSPNWMDAPAQNNEADAAYIAAANPAAILELIAAHEDAQGEIRALRERVKALEEGLRRATDALDLLTDKVDGTGFAVSDEFSNALDEIDLGRALLEQKP